MTDVAVFEPSATLRETYLSARLTHSFNDIVDRAERLRAMQQLADTRFNELGYPGRWRDFARGLARFPQLSPANVFLVLDQHPTAARLSTHRGWLAMQRRPIERGIAILIPSIRHKRVDGRTVWDGGRPVVEEVRQRPATVFDYSSTAGAHAPAPWDEPQHGPRPGFMDDLRAASAAIGFSVEASNQAAPRERRVFTLIHGQDERAQTLRLAHDLGAAAAGNTGAALFAYVLCTANGMDMQAPESPQDPQQAATVARAGLRRVLQRTTFRNML